MISFDFPIRSLVRECEWHLNSHPESGQSDSIFSRRMKYVVEITKSYQEKKKKNVHLIKSIFPPLRRSTLVQNMTIQKRLIQYISFLWLLISIPWHEDNYLLKSIDNYYILSNFHHFFYLQVFKSGQEYTITLFIKITQ